MKPTFTSRQMPCKFTRHLAFMLCLGAVSLALSPARHCHAVEALPAPMDAQDGGAVEGTGPEDPGQGPGADAPAPVADLSPILAAQQEIIGGQGEMLAVLKSCNTLLLSLALFELFRFARGMSRRAFKKGVSNG